MSERAGSPGCQWVQAVRRLWGQVDLKPVLVSVLSAAVISAFGFLWSKVAKVDVLEATLAAQNARLARIEDGIERLSGTRKR